MIIYVIRKITKKKEKEIERKNPTRDKKKKI